MQIELDKKQLHMLARATLDDLYALHAENRSLSDLIEESEVKYGEEEKSTTAVHDGTS